MQNLKYAEKDQILITQQIVCYKCSYSEHYINSNDLILPEKFSLSSIDPGFEAEIGLYNYIGEKLGSV